MTSPSRAKTKSESSIIEPKYTKLSTGRITKQRLQIIPEMKPTRKQRDDSEDETESSDDDNDEDYEDKYVERKMKSESNGPKRRSSDEGGKVTDIKDEDDDDDFKDDVKEEEPLFSVLPTIKDEVEREFLTRLNQFMNERAFPFPKQTWMGLREGK